MKKPDILRSMLLTSVPSIGAAPETLSMFIDKGRVAARLTKSLSFEHRYTLNIVVQDYAGDMNTLFVPLLAWIAHYQPDLFERGEQEPFTFEAEILDGDCADVSINLELTERVRVERDGSQLTPKHLDEPSRADTFDDVTTAPLWCGVLDDVIAGTATIVPEP